MRSPFATARAVESKLDAVCALNGAGEPPPVRWGPLVKLPAYDDGQMYWGAVWWVALAGVVGCWRSAPTARGLAVFRSVDAAVEWGVVV
jgi:hypothetical protein